MTTAETIPNQSDASRARARLDWARTATGDAALELQRASTDAGFRSYWRGDTDGGSRIVMDSPPGLEDVRPWLRVRELLERGGVRVPRVLARDVEAGFLLLEDLGQATCLQAMQDGDAEALFDAALVQLLKLQAIACPPDLPDYDEALLRRELALFDDWFLARHLGIELEPGERAALARAGDLLVAAARAQPQVLVHRDFMPRNLMPAGDAVAVLDFQDAVRGPIAYDVLSLFKDAFASWPADTVARGIDAYHARAVAAGLPVPGRERFQRDSDLVGVQRHLKVLGIFARLQHRDGKPKYLADAPRFLAYLGETLPRYPELAALDALLQRRVLPRFSGDGIVSGA